MALFTKNLSIPLLSLTGLLCLFSPETVLASNDEKPYNILWLSCEDIDPEYKEKLEELRSALASWQLETGDKGFIPEHDLVNMMWPGFVQPETEEVTFSSKKDDTCILTSETKGASIAYQKGDSIGQGHWQLYSKPVEMQPDEQIKARAVRLGYKTSDVTSFTY